MTDPAALAELRQRLIGWRPDLVGTLMFVVDAGRVLLMRKLRGHGAGKINAPGGKLERGESALCCALRETAEEVGVRPRGAELAAVMRFVDADLPDWLGYVYLARAHDGRPAPSAEAIPAWYALADVPYHDMWEDDRHWLPRVLAGERLRGDFLFRAGRLVAHELHPLEPTGH